MPYQFAICTYRVTQLSSTIKMIATTSSAMTIKTNNQREVISKHHEILSILLSGPYLLYFALAGHEPFTAVSALLIRTNTLRKLRRFLFYSEKLHQTKRDKQVNLARYHDHVCEDRKYEKFHES